MRVVVSDARGAAAADAAAITAGIPSRALMQRAGAAAAAEIAVRRAGELSRGVVVATGAGNNGGDGWVIARALHAAGVSVRVVECAEARTADAIAERALALADGVRHVTGSAELTNGNESLVIDALLGTGFSAAQPLRDEMAQAVANIVARERQGSSVIALDLPSGLDATTGAAQGELHASLTITFGTIKRGLLRARSRCGEIVAVDIGLGEFALHAKGGVLATTAWFAESLPTISADAHKGTRKKVAIVGGAKGMAGAVILAAKAALRSGAGLVKCVVHDESVLALQKAEPAALAASWPTDAATWKKEVGEWADVVLIGPGLGRENARQMVEAVLSVFRGAVVLDADALNAYECSANELGVIIGERIALLTPHPLEFHRLAGTQLPERVSGATSRGLPPIDVERQHEIALATNATVLVKGTPTVLVNRAGDSTYVAEGTAILATGGSGDVLGGIAATLVAHTGDAMTGGALAAFAHGRAAFGTATRQVRGYTIEDVIAELPHVWSLQPPAPRPPVIAELHAVWDSP